MLNNKGVSFCFTDFNEKNINNGYQSMFDDNNDVIRGIAWGRETCPSTGKQHNQGFIQLYKQARWTSIQKMMMSKCHFEVMNGSIAENETYCSKENKYCKLGAFVTKGFRTDLHCIKDDLKNGVSLHDIMDNYTGDYVRYYSGISKMKELIDKKNSQKWRDVETTAIVGDAGSGKTSYVYKKYGYENVFKVDSGGDLQKFPFNGYDGEKVLLIDDFNGWIQYTYMLNVLDGHPLQLNIKNGYTFARWEKVYITSNVKPANWYNVIGDNFKRRINKCLLVTKGITERLSHPWLKTNEIEYN